MSAKDVVRACIDAINANDKARILSFFSEQSIFDNVPIGAVQGPAAIWAVLENIHSQASAVAWEVHRIEQGPSGTVYTERTDRYQLAGQWAAFRCAGIHEVNAEGKITLWRDYFDLASCLATMPGA